MSDTASKTWAIVEIFGHRKVAGCITAPDGSDWAGGLIRIDIYTEERELPEVTQYFGEKAIFSITPTTENICRRLGAISREPAPVAVWEMQLPPARDVEEEHCSICGADDGSDCMKSASICPMRKGEHDENEGRSGILHSAATWRTGGDATG